jgi:hypothetical protein
MRVALMLMLLAVLTLWSRTQLELAPIQGRAEQNQAPEATPPAQANAPPQTGVTVQAIPPLFRELQTPQPPQRLREDLVMLGVVSSSGQQLAHLRDTADGATILIRVGDRVGAWTVDRVDERCAVLAKRRERKNICLS